MSKKHFLWGTLVLTCTGLLSRLMGFFYRIFLSRSIGAQGLGIYQLAVPVQGIVLAVTASGIQSAISRLCASCIAVGKEKKAGEFLVLGTAVSFILSALVSVFLYKNAAFFAIEILKEKQTLPLIRLLCFSFPLSAVHTCINSYYFARKRTEFPSAVQLLEQTVRVGGCYVLYLIFLSEGKAITPVIAVGGTLASEAAASLTSMLAVSLHFQKTKAFLFPFTSPASDLKELGQMAFPLSLNRLLLTILSGIETILIPQMLLAFGHSSQEALSIYGIFTGMALPLLFFPSTIIHSASALLLPSVAELQALGYQKRIRYVINQVSRYCLLLGTSCTCLFFFFGKPLGHFLFNSTMAGSFIRTMSFLCPFLYLNITFSSILGGLGRPGLCLLHSLASICIRICFVIFAIPVMGIQGYLYGILLSELILTLLNIRFFAFSKSSGAGKT